MKILKMTCLAIVAGSLLIGQASCSSMTQTGKGALIGGGGGAAVGAGVGALIGGGKGAGIGSLVGAAVGAGAGALIGNRMDKQQQELEQELGNQATVEKVEDTNGLQAIKVTFEGGILFPTGKYTLSPNAQTNLARFATSLKTNPDTNVQIYGYTDNTGSYQVNEKLSGERADAVMNFLVNSGVSRSRLSAQGIPMANYVATNETAAGRAQNRRVEIYITADQNMIRQAEEGTLR